DRNGAFEMQDRLACLALRHQHSAEAALRVGVIGRERRDVPVFSLGLGKLPGAMMSDRGGKQRRHFLGMRGGGERAEGGWRTGASESAPLLAIHCRCQWTGAYLAETKGLEPSRRLWTV